MESIGVIRAERDPPGINHDRWVALIDKHPNLLHPPPIEGINSFTRGPMIAHPRPDVASVVIEGQEIGMMYWSENEANQINVFGDSQTVAQLAHEVANLLGGLFEADPT
ncbi:MAG: hypothetical protein IAG10_16060 [Planctomycetaceae bacterium]|nr:hypothetical protein [Planctomycetaceae bacterium]